MGNTQVHHIGLTVSDLERSVRFYTELFDLDDIARIETTSAPKVDQNLGVSEAHIQAVLLLGSNSIVEFIQYLDSSAGEQQYNLRNRDVGCAHAAFTVDDIEAFASRLRDQGITSNEPVDPIPAGRPGAGSRFMYFQDPDGFTIEVLQPGPDVQVAERI